MSVHTLQARAQSYAATINSLGERQFEVYAVWTTNKPTEGNQMQLDLAV